MPTNKMLLERSSRAAGRRGVVDGFARHTILRVLSGITVGSLEINEEGRLRRFGDPAVFHPARLEVLDPACYSLLLGRGLNGLAEAYMDGLWKSPDLTSLLRTGIRNMDVADSLAGPAAWVSRTAQSVVHRLSANTRRGSRRNITAHYDLGDDFFGLFLDPTMSYSCAVFDQGHEDLEAGSLRKIDLLCDKLDLGPEDHLLEIGTGWGGFAVRTAQRTGCRVTTTTISDNQHATAKKRIAEAGLEDKITVLHQDYRDLEGQFDKLVSVEMIEAVGHEYLPGFFATCDRLLKPGGRFALQAITIRDQNYDAARRYADFIKTYVFPGSCLPSVTRMLECTTSKTSLVLHDLHDIGLDYAKTLRLWRQAFLEHRGEARALGLDDPFLNMWDYYLAYCEAGFLERHISDVQMVFAKPGDSRRIWRG